MNQHIENLTHAHHSAGFTLANLRMALPTAGNVETLLLIPLIERAQVLENDIGQLLQATQTDDINAMANYAQAREQTA